MLTFRRALAACLIGLPLVPAAAEGIAAAMGDWSQATWRGIPPAHWEPLPGGGLRVVARDGQGSFLWRRTRGTATCLTWRWRVDAGPGPARLDRRGSDDRALGLYVGFDGWPPRVSPQQRAAHIAAQGLAGSRQVPRSVLAYAWGGTGEEPRPFVSPHMAGLGSVRVLRTAAAERGAWLEERVNLEADWRASFGAPPPPVIEIAVGSHTENSRARVDARIEDIRLVPCAP